MILQLKLVTGLNSKKKLIFFHFIKQDNILAHNVAFVLKLKT